MDASLITISVPCLLITLVLISLCIYFWTFTKWHYWKIRGVPYLKPVLPVLGNIYDLLLLRSLPDITNRIYKETEGFPYHGIYIFHTPVFFVRDLDLITKILVNDFHHFEDRGFHFNFNDSLGRNLIHQNGTDWRYSRSKLAPCYNIGRVKSMLPVMKSKSELLVQMLEKELVQSSNSVIEPFDIILRYTTDVVTSFSFGVDANSLQNKKDQFFEESKHMLGFYFLYHVFTGCFFPRLHNFLGISVAKVRVKKFFHEVIQQMINYRRENKCNKKDTLDMLLQMKEESAMNMSEKQIPNVDNNFIVAQAFGFFFAGFETPGIILTCALYEIAKSPHIQETLIKEIHNVLNKNEGEITFDALQDMKYLRQVIAETLRLYAPLTLIFRRCTKDYTIPGTSTTVEKGTLVLIPLRSIHDDPKYYPDPEVFDPDRFSEVNSAARHTAAYMPFGIGPRFCPAVLYSHMMLRMAVVHVLCHFEVCIAEETPPFLQANPTKFLLFPNNSIPLTFKRRHLYTSDRLATSYS